MSNFMPQTATATEIKIGEVEQEIGRIVLEREQLDRLIQVLETRLASVLANRAPNTKGDGVAGSQPEPVRVPLADQLHQQAFNLSQMGLQLSLIIDRIEL